MSWTWQHVERIHLIWAALIVVGLAAYLELEARRSLSVFMSPVMQRRLASQAGIGRILTKHALVLAAFVFAILAVMRPQGRGETETVTASRSTADVIFALDTSRSMLADDTAPTRLSRAKAEINQLIDRLDGQRVGLIAFAGRAAMVCPLTPDHSFFRTALSTVDTRSAGRGGTKIGEAIKVATRSFPSGRGAKLLVLITDGDDQDKYSEEAAKLARDGGVKIVAVGLGSEAGSQITLVDPQTGAKTTLMHEGKPVISKLDAEQLRKIALVTEGIYIPAGTSAIDLDSIMDSYVQPIVRDAAAQQTRVAPVEKYPWLLLLSLACLLAALWVGSLQEERA